MPPAHPTPPSTGEHDDINFRERDVEAIQSHTHAFADAAPRVRFLALAVGPRSVQSILIELRPHEQTAVPAPDPSAFSRESRDGRSWR
jgi:hypothetical protein